MTYSDLDAARDYYYLLRNLIEDTPRGPGNPRAMHALRKLCRAAAVVTDDRECAIPLVTIEEYGAKLFSSVGEEHLRAQMLRELEWYRARLFAIEAARAR